jgi:hypothetical protein
MAMAGKNQAAGGAGAHGWQQKLANLSPAEREQVKAAHKAAKHDPTVEAAKVKMREARKEYHDAMRAAMLKANPSIEPVLNKIPEGHGRRDS